MQIQVHQLAGKCAGEIVSHKGCFFYLGCHYVCMGEGQCPLTLNQTYILTMEFKLSMFVQQKKHFSLKRKKKAVQNNMITE